MAILKNLLWINAVLIPLMLFFILVKFAGFDTGLAAGICFAVFVFDLGIAWFLTPRLIIAIEKTLNRSRQ